jgi:hypothetical protein
MEEPVSAIENRLRQLSLKVRNRLPELLVPRNDEKESERQQAHLAQLGDELLILIRDLKSQENLVRVQGRNKSSDAWATKQKLANVRSERAEAEALAREIDDILRRRGLNPFEVGYKVHELIENSEIHAAEAQRAIAELRTIHPSIGPANESAAPHMTPLHMLDTAVPVVVSAYLLLRWAANKSSAGKKISRAG